MFVQGGLDILKIDQNSINYNVSFLNLGGFGLSFGGTKPNKALPWRWDWRVLQWT